MASLLEPESACSLPETRPSLLVLYLFLILALGTTIRICCLGEYPTGLGRDEVSTGYDAWSLMQTGRDQYGEILPLFARSYGDFNEALYRYLAVPSVFIFGLDDFSIRLPAALFGSLSILLLFLVGKEILGVRAALFQAFFLAVSPWHFHYSRVAFRVILFPFFLLLALWLWTKAIKRPTLLPVAAAAFVLAAYTYSSARVFVPLFLLGLILVFFRCLAEMDRKILVVSFLVLLTGFSALAFFWFSPHGMSRAEGVLVIQPGQWILSYLRAFDPRFLLGGSKDFFLSEMTGYGLLYVLEAPFLLLGLSSIFFGASRGKPFQRILVLGLLLYPIPAIFTGIGFPRRALIGSVFFPLFSGLGLCLVLTWIKRPFVRRMVGTAILMTVLSMTSDFLSLYVKTYTPASWFHWDHGWEEAIKYAVDHSSGDILISNSYPTPHFFILFYTKYPPRKYQENPKQMEGRGQKIKDFRLGRFEVGEISDFSDLEDVPELVMCRPEEIGRLDSRFAYHVEKEIRSPIGYVPIVILRLRTRNHNP